MGSCSIITLLVVGAFAFTSANLLVPENKEVVYEYKALVKTGALYPAPFASEAYLFGKVHLQRSGNSIFARLSDLTFKLYNGELNCEDEMEADEIPLPQENADLLRVFKINYDAAGKVVSIVTEAEEKEYSRNMKKALASILQIDLAQINFDSTTTHAFRTIEMTLHGPSEMLYSVLPEDQKVMVEKMLEIKSTRPMYDIFVTSANIQSCAADFEDPMSYDSQIMYEIVMRDGQRVVEHMEALGGIRMYPFQAKSEYYYMEVNQTLELMEVMPIQEQLEVKSEKQSDNLHYVVADYSNENGAVPDLSNGRSVYDMPKLMQNVEQMLNEMMEYMNQDHIHTRMPDIKKGQLVNRIVREMMHLDQPSVEQLYNTLSEKTSDNDKMALEVFHQLLPLVGTRATLLQIKDMVKNKKVDERVAMEMLQNMAFYVKYANEKLLQDLEEMMNWGTDLKWAVRKTAILSFATIVDKHRVMEMRMLGEEIETVENPVVVKYVEMFMNKAKSAEDFETQMIFMEALYNIPSKSIVKLLEPIVKGEIVMKDPNMQMLAMDIIFRPLLSEPDKLFELFWPILDDRTLHSEMRIIAYYYIMSSKPNMSRLLNIDWLMSDEPCPELYHYHYTYLQNWMHSTDSCSQQFRLNIAQLLRGTHEPNEQAWSLYRHADYVDKQFGFGSAMTISMIDTKKVSSVYLDASTTVFNMPMSMYSAYLRIEGMDESVADKVRLLNDDTTKMFNYEELWNLITSIPNMKDINIIFIMLQQDQIVESYFMDSTNIKDVLPELLQLDSLVRDSIHISYDMYGKVHTFNDMGLPVSMENLIPTVTQHEVKMSSDNENKVVNFHIDNRCKSWRHSRSGLSFYNPIADAWQGIDRFISFDAVMPIHADISINVPQQKMKISMMRHQDESKNIMGWRHHVTNMVYVLEGPTEGILEHSCPKCKDWTKVSRGEGYAMNKTIVDEEGYNTGLHYLMEVYDSERDTSVGSLQKLQHDLFSSDKKNFQTMFGHMLMYMSHSEDRMIMSPTPGNNGIMYKVSPSTVNPITQIDLSLRMNQVISHENEVFLPGMKLSTRGTYTLKNNEQVVKTWDLNTVLELNPGHTLNTLNMQLTRIIPGQKDFSVCVEGTKKWNKDSVTGEMKINMGQTTEGKCNKDEASLDIEMVGEQLEAQKTPYHTYGRCLEKDVYQNLPDYHGMYCTAAHTSIRNYTYDVKATNFPSEFKRSAWKWFDIVKSYYMPYYTYDAEHEQIDDNSIKVEVVYPLFNKEMNVKVVVPEYNYKFESIPDEEWNTVGLTPDNTHYSRMLMFMHTMGMMQTCMVSHDSIRHGCKRVEYQVPNEWTALVSNAEKDSQHGVFVKQVEGNKLALKLMHDTHSVEITPEREHMGNFKIMVDGKEQTGPQDAYSEDWFVYMVRPKMHSIVLTTFHFNLHMEYDGNKLHIEIPQTDVNMFGECMMRV